jgi:hypothetical protein
MTIDDRYMAVCPRCKRITLLNLKVEDVIKYKNGMRAKDAFPYLTNVARMTFVRGYYANCQPIIFGSILPLSRFNA